MAATAPAQIRPYRPGDRSQVLALAPRLTQGVAPWRNPAAVRRAAHNWVQTSIDTVDQPGRAVYIAVASDRVVGVVSIREQTHFTGQTDAYVGELVVASGMARGIDAAAHLGALDSGSVAVVAGGADVVYPEENRGLYDALVERGAVVAELPLGTEPQARHFPRRNRIISGMARGVVVVEAAAKSGSLITARFALEQGREVFAVPGSPLDPRSRGCNDLLRNGATLTETAADSLAHLGPFLQREMAAPRPRERASQPRLPLAAAAPNLSAMPQIAEDAALELLIEKLSPTPVAVDELVRQCHLSAASIATLLLELELAGRIERHPGNLVSLR